MKSYASSKMTCRDILTKISTWGKKITWFKAVASTSKGTLSFHPAPWTNSQMILAAWALKWASSKTEWAASRRNSAESERKKLTKFSKLGNLPWRKRDWLRKFRKWRLKMCRHKGRHRVLGLLSRGYRARSKARKMILNWCCSKKQNLKKW